MQGASRLGVQPGMEGAFFQSLRSDGSNLGPGASCWKVGSYLPMPSGLQCSMHWFPPPVKLPVAI